MENSMQSTAYLKPRAAAAYACLSVASLARMRVEGNGPRFIKVGHRSVLYDRCDLDSWLCERKRRCTADLPQANGHCDG